MFKKLQTEIKENKIHLLLLFLYTAIVVFFCSKMSPFYAMQEWSDVNLYFNIGKAVMNGQVLYAESFDHKGPIIFLIYGIGYLISNDSFLGLFFIEVLTWTVLTFSAYFIGKLFFNKIYSFLSASVFLLLFITHTLGGGAAEEFITAFMAVSMYLFIRFFRNPRKHPLSQMYVHGLMWGLVFFTKFNLVVFWIFPLLAIGVLLLMQKEYKNLIHNILIFIAGGLTIALPIGIYFLANHAMGDAIDTYFILNASSNTDISPNIIHKIITSLYQRLRFETIEFAMVLIGAFVFPMLYLKNNVARIALILTFLSLFFIVHMAGYIYYYSIPYYLFSALGCISIAGIVSKFFKIQDKWYVIALAFLILIPANMYNKKLFMKYEKSDTVGAKNVIEQFLPTIMKEEDRSLVNLGLDEANALFTYADIMPTVKYFVAPNLPHSRYPQLRDEQTKYIEESKTNFVILAEYTNNALYFSELDALKENYEVVDKFKEYYLWLEVDRYYYLYKRKKK